MGWGQRGGLDIYIPALFMVAQIGRNAKFSLTQIYKNDFWVQRVAKDEGSRVFINPPALSGVCGIV